MPKMRAGRLPTVRRVRQRILGDHRIAADERVLPDPAELMDARAGADVGEVLDRDVAAERRHVAENRVVADVAVVRHVHVGHEHVAVADRRHPAAAARPAVDRHELAEDVSLPTTSRVSSPWYFKS